MSLTATIVEAGFGNWHWRIRNNEGLAFSNQLPFGSEAEARENLLNTMAAMKNGVDKVEVENYKWLR